MTNRELRPTLSNMTALGPSWPSRYQGTNPEDALYREENSFLVAG